MEKKKIALKIFSIIMMILSVRGVFFVTTGTDFSFTGLPMYAIYLILFVVILVTLLFTWLAFIRKSK